ncbi:MAG: DsbA family protein [Prevotellaceae bacterium]|jgi:protein-disulfide isomerase|nr:DsbA family protein [Prevotellaceae bacterium]
MNLHVTPNDHIQGAKDALIEMIEYGDYQCPYCRKAYYILKELPAELRKNIRLVFRNFPLQDLHEHALHAAIAAEVAASQGKFWEMHDIIFENQHYLSDSDLIKYAREIGLDVERFKNEFGNDQFFEKVKSDFESGERNGVEGTPTFFINGEIFEGNWMGAEFTEYLQSLI